ncbi:MAG: acyl carrier protein [Alphaproteobacteria bacterium]|nr:acyl carrier protein [Alphaproteobacteria bacterium]
MTIQDIQSTILDYLRDDMLVDVDQLELDQNLLASGHIDSFGFIEMITSLEKKFQIKFTDDDIQKPEITSVSGIADIIASRIEKAA